MLDLIRNVLSRLTGNQTMSHKGAACEMNGMGPRDLNDLGIGAGEIPYILEGGNQGARWFRSSRALQPVAAKDCSAGR